MGLREVALTIPERIAIVIVESGECRTFRERAERADEYANLLPHYGCRMNDSVACAIENCLEFFEGPVMERSRELTIISAVCRKSRSISAIRRAA